MPSSICDRLTVERKYFCYSTQNRITIQAKDKLGKQTHHSKDSVYSQTCDTTSTAFVLNIFKRKAYDRMYVGNKRNLSPFH